MSILNAFVTPDLGLVAVDTETSLTRGAHYEISKLFPLVGSHAVLAFRGSVAFVIGVIGRSIASACDFDELAKRMPDMLLEASEAAITQAGRLSLTPEFLGCGEVAMVGFSPMRSKITGHYWIRETLDAGFMARSDIDSLIAPCGGLDALGLTPSDILQDRENMERLAVEQVRLMREAKEYPGIGAGGRLILAEIRRNSMTIETGCKLPARPESPTQQAPEGGAK